MASNTGQVVALTRSFFSGYVLLLHLEKLREQEPTAPVAFTESRSPGDPKHASKLTSSADVKRIGQEIHYGIPEIIMRT
jgi:hypothetical protein